MRGTTARPVTPATLSVYQAAQVCGVVPATAYAWVREGEIPSVRLGGRIRIPTAKLADLLGLPVEAVVAALDPGAGGESR